MSTTSLSQNSPEQPGTKRNTPVVAVTSSPGVGTVVRWYRADSLVHPLLTASRQGVQIHGDVYLHDLPDEWVTAAKDAHLRLLRDPDADLTALASGSPKEEP